jgi:hypothetical protein
MMLVSLTEARDCAQFAADDLRGAMKHASAVEALVILPMIAEAQALADRIGALIAAKGASE